jgi:hypothetical protein
MTGAQLRLKPPRFRRASVRNQFRQGRPREIHEARTPSAWADADARRVDVDGPKKRLDFPGPLITETPELQTVSANPSPGDKFFHLGLEDQMTPDGLIDQNFLQLSATNTRAAPWVVVTWKRSGANRPTTPSSRMKPSSPMFRDLEPGSMTRNSPKSTRCGASPEQCADDLPTKFHPAAEARLGSRRRGGNVANPVTMRRQHFVPAAQECNIASPTVIFKISVQPSVCWRRSSIRKTCSPGRW